MRARSVCFVFSLLGPMSDTAAEASFGLIFECQNPAKSLQPENMP